jgi:hypothetical protein
VNYSTFHKILQCPANNNKILKYWFDTKNDTTTKVVFHQELILTVCSFKYGIKILSYQSNGSEKGDNKFYTVQFSSSLRSLKILLVIL